jgi:hypothetical protein
MSTEGQTGYFSRRCSGTRTLYRDQEQRSRCCGYATGLKILGSNSGRGKKIFLFSEKSSPALEPIQPPFQWVPEFFTGGKAVGGVDDQPRPSCTEVKN